MNRNDILRRIRFIFDYDDNQMLAIFKLAEHEVGHQDLLNWFRKEEDPAYVEMTDRELAVFLNGLINKKRGKREGPQPEPEDKLNNNIIFRKMRIALNLTTEDIVELYDSVDFIVSPHEINAFFRRPNHKSYKRCLDQFLRTFFNALQWKYRKISAEGPKRD